MFDPQSIDKIKKARDAWAKEFDGTRQQKMKFITVSGEPIDPLYTPLELQGHDFMEKIGFPGQYPYTRGVYPSMYRGRHWTMRQFSGMGSAKDTNQRYHYLLKHGQTGLSVAFDMPTLMGYDSDHVFSHGEVGKCGVTVDSLKDMEIIFDGIPLDKISTSMTINAPASILLAMYIVVGEKQGLDQNILTGTLQNDILKEYIAQKEWIYPPEPSMRLIVDTIEYCTNYVPKWNTISISGYHIREAGATAVQELAFTLADGFAYVEAGIERGLDVDDFAPRLSHFFNSHLDFFEEIAKYRAARRIWARRMKEKYGAKNPKSLLMRFHTQTAGCSLTAQQPYNNIVRTAIQGLAAAIGGTQSLHTNSMDETYALPSEEAVKIALRTQQLIAYETGVTNTIDPLAGSYFVEKLTDRMEEEAEAYFEEIDKRGGVIPAIEEGYFQREIARAAYRYQQAIETGDRTVVGVNRFAEEEENVKIPLLKIDESVELDQVEALEKIRKARDNDAVKRSLDKLRLIAEGTENTMPATIECVRNYCTEGEICDIFREVFGEYQEKSII
ncbi:methylmalonyl-CoA mutase family protein [bacterium]|nr:methylmalonyl-CoA mutase family protein [bacterium]